MVEEAKEAIISLLSDHDAYSDEIYNLAEELDISKSTLKRARAELTSEGIIKPKSFRQGGHNHFHARPFFHKQTS